MMRLVLGARKRPGWEGARHEPRPVTPKRRTTRGLAVVVIASLCACADAPGRWSGTEWWAEYAALPELRLQPISAGALDETTQPFPAARRVAVSSEGRIAVVQEGIPAVWVYDARGRPLGRGGRSEIMDARGPGRTRVWATRAGWLPEAHLWVAERGGSVAVFNADLAFSDVWDPPGDGDPVAVSRPRGRLVALVLSRDTAGIRLGRVTRGGATEAIADVAAGDTLVVCPGGGCFVTVAADSDSTGYEVSRQSIGGGADVARYTLPPAPVGAREGDEGALLPRPARDVLADDDGRVWLGLAADGSEWAYWLVLDPSGAPIGRFQLAAGDRGVLADDGVLWTRRDAEGVTWLHRYSVALP